MTSDTCVNYFDETKECILYCDASPVGISAILMQKSRNGEKVICYSSKALTETEQRYLQTERECLSVVYACERYRLYLLGRNFTVYTDHKTLVNLMKNPNSKIPLRIERMFIRISGYDFEFKYVKGVENISDYRSRHPFYNPNQNDENEAYINFVAT